MGHAHRPGESGNGGSDAGERSPGVDRLDGCQRRELCECGQEPGRMRIVLGILHDGIYRIKQPWYDDLNFIANQMVNDVTSLFRYDDSFGFNVRSFLNEMSGPRNLNFFTCSRAPFYDQTGALLKGESNDDPSL